MSKKPEFVIEIENGKRWFTVEEIAEVFDAEVSTIKQCIQDIYDEGELSKDNVGATRYYFDMVLSVGYRVNTKQGRRFRQWSIQLLSEYELKGFILDDDRLSTGKFA